jgi:hypothetical protein
MEKNKWEQEIPHCLRIIAIISIATGPGGGANYIGGVWGEEYTRGRKTYAY